MAFKDIDLLDKNQLRLRLRTAEGRVRDLRNENLRILAELRLMRRRLKHIGIGIEKTLIMGAEFDVSSRKRRK